MDVIYGGSTPDMKSPSKREARRGSRYMRRIEPLSPIKVKTTFDSRAQGMDLRGTGEKSGPKNFELSGKTFCRLAKYAIIWALTKSLFT